MGLFKPWRQDSGGISPLPRGVCLAWPVRALFMKKTFPCPFWSRKVSSYTLPTMGSEHFKITRSCPISADFAFFLKGGAWLPEGSSIQLLKRKSFGQKFTFLTQAYWMLCIYLYINIYIHIYILSEAWRTLSRVCLYSGRDAHFCRLSVMMYSFTLNFL